MSPQRLMHLNTWSQLVMQVGKASEPLGDEEPWWRRWVTEGGIGGCVFQLPLQPLLSDFEAMWPASVSILLPSLCHHDGMNAFELWTKKEKKKKNRSSLSFLCCFLLGILLQNLEINRYNVNNYIDMQTIENNFYCYISSLLFLVVKIVE